MNCLTRFHWATEAIENLVYISYFLILLCSLVIFFQTFKSNLTANRPFQTSFIISGYKVPLTKTTLSVPFGISDVNSDIFEGP